MKDIITLTITSITTIIVGYIAYKKDVKLKAATKLNAEMAATRSVLDSLSEFNAFNSIKTCISELFDSTKATRFLILVAVNGETTFNNISVVFEHHADRRDNVSMIKYKNISVDDAYRKMLKMAEVDGPVLIDVDKMEDCLLRKFYEIEGVKHSKVTFLSRQKIDRKNDVVIYSSIATGNLEGYTDLELVKFRLAYDSIITPTIRNLFQ